MTSHQVTRTWSGEETGAPSALAVDDRYELLELLGRGGMGAVYRVWDRVLERHLAMKIMRGASPVRRALFEREARFIARLQHPSIIAIHDVGETGDGKLFFTMPQVRGQTLRAAIKAAHRAGPLALPVLRRLVAKLKRACDGIAYAHTQGVLHRDIKPENIMLGRFGEVFVLDFGVAVALDLAAYEAQHTRGTYAYMAPEQARGEDTLSPASDVYALGACLFELMVGSPWRTGTTTELLQQARRGAGPAPRRFTGLPEALAAVCRQATAPELLDRPPDAGSLAALLADWLDGTENHGRALALVARADTAEASIAEMRARAAATAAEAAARMEALSPLAAEADKLGAWALEDAAQQQQAALTLLQAQHERLLLEALTLTPELPEAHQRLAATYRAQHEAVELAGVGAEAARLEYLLRRHDRGEHAAYLAGTGELLLRTTRPVLAQLRPLRLYCRRMCPGPAQPLPTGEPVVLPMGSYRVELTDPETGLVVLLPVVIRRAQRWVGDGRGEPVLIPLPGWLGAETCYVPGGPFSSGGDPHAYGTPLPTQERLVGSFAIQRVPVTNADWLRFLDDLVRQGRADEALQHVPRTRSRTPGALGDMVYGRRPDGTFCLVPDRDGDLWLPSWPVVMVTVPSMEAYARWMRERTGRAWALPTEWQWEKAARGTDRRIHPWGTAHFDPTWCHMTESHGDRRRGPVVVGSSPIDVSPYGVQDLAGNVLDVCADPYSKDGVHPVAGLRVARGGNWAAARGKSRICYRGPVSEDVRSSYVGFRLVHPVGVR